MKISRQFHDDPWLTPYKNNTKRDFSLAKEAGRKSARYILNRYYNMLLGARKQNFQGLST